jgi:O-antigen/teichoic acid export membrane protein
MSVASWIERKIRLDMSWLIGNSMWLVAGRVSRMAAGVGITVLFARLVVADIFGQYQLLISIVTIVSISTLPGFNGSLFRAIARGYDGTVKAVINLSIVFGMIGVVVLIAAASYMFVVGQTTIAIGLLASSVLFPFVHIFNRWGNIYNAKELFRLGALYSIFMALVLFVGMAIAIILFRDSAVLIFISFLVINGVLNLAIYLRSLRYLSNDRVEQGWKASGHKLMLSHAFGILYTHADKLVIGYVLGVRAVAVYVIAISLGDAVKAVLVNGIVVYKSKIFRLDDSSIRHVLHHYVLLMVILAFIIVGALWLLIPILVPLIFSDAYVDSIPYAKAYLLIIPFSLMGTALGVILIKMKKEYSYFLSSVVSGVVNLVLYLVLIPRMGIMGAVVASIIFHGIQSVLRYVMVLDGVPARASK